MATACRLTIPSLDKLQSSDEENVTLPNAKFL